MNIGKYLQLRPCLEAATKLLQHRRDLGTLLTLNIYPQSSRRTPFLTIYCIRNHMHRQPNNPLRITRCTNPQIQPPTVCPKLPTRPNSPIRRLNPPPSPMDTNMPGLNDGWQRMNGTRMRKSTMLSNGSMSEKHHFSCDLTILS